MKREEIVLYLKARGYGHLATLASDGTPRVRPMALHTVYGDSLYFFTLAQTRKVAELGASAHVEAVWLDPKENSQLRIRGKAQIENDETIIAQFKRDNPMVTEMLPSDAQHLVQIYRVDPTAVEWAHGLVPYKEIPWNESSPKTC